MPHGRGLLQALTVLLIVKKFPILCRTWKFITVFATACHLVLSFTTLIQSKTPHPMHLRPTLVLPPILHQSSKATLSFGFTPRNHLCSALLLQPCYMSHPFPFSLFWSPKQYTYGNVNNHKASIGTLEKRKMFYPSRESNPGTPSLQPGSNTVVLLAILFYHFPAFSLGSLELFPLILLISNHSVSWTALMSHFIWHVLQLFNYPHWHFVYTVHFHGQHKVLL
jgi:hypothetical protein